MEHFQKPRCGTRHLSPRFVRERKPKFEIRHGVANMFSFKPVLVAAVMAVAAPLAIASPSYAQGLGTKAQGFAGGGGHIGMGADTWAVAAGAAGITWAWVEAGEAAVLAGPAAGGVEVGVAGFIPALLVAACWAARGVGAVVGDRLITRTLPPTTAPRTTAMTIITMMVPPPSKATAMAGMPPTASSGSNHTMCVPEPIWATTANAIAVRN